LNESVFGGIFGCVGKKVVEDLIYFVGIEITGDIIGIAYYRKVKFFLLYQGAEAFGFCSYEIRQVSIQYTQLEIAAFGFTKFKYLLKEAHQPGDVLCDDSENIVGSRGSHLQFVDRCRNDG